MERVIFALAGAVAALAFGVAGSPPATSAEPLFATCSSGYVDGIIGGEHKCLHTGEFCSPTHEADYERYGFSCVNGRLQSGGSLPKPTTTTTSSGGSASYPDIPILLQPKTKSTGCKVGPLPDRSCSPGAYSKSLTMAVICSPTFRTGSIRDVSTETKHQVEQEYGLASKSYGRTLEIDHIVSLELGGSNNIANLYPELASYPLHQPGYHTKDTLENAAHDAVCTGKITLAYARQQIAANWQRLYQKLFGVLPPTG